MRRIRLPDFLRSIRVRLTLWYVAVLAALLVLFAVGVYSYLTASIGSQIDGVETSFHHQLQYATARTPNQTEARVIQSNSLLGSITEVYAPSIFAGAYACQGPSAKQGCSKSALKAITAVLISHRQGCQTPARRLSCTWLVTSRKTGQVVGAVNLQASLASAYHARDQLGTRLLLGIPIGILVALLGGWVLASRALSPVDQLRRLADSITGSDLSRRIGLKQGDELGRLSKTLDGMIERLEFAFHEQRQLTADVSHELRTPLAVIQAQAALARRRTRTPDEYATVLGSIEEEAGHMSRIVEDLLLLARAEAGQEVIQKDLMRLDKVAEWAAQHADRLARGKGITLKLNLQPVMVDADEARIRQLARNLVDNAVKYTDAGGVISICVSKQTDAAVLEVRDTGEGIDTESLPHIFQRFYRTDQARTRGEGGSGLGLAITRWIAEAHGGSIAVESTRGEGTTFTVRLPLRDAHLLEPDDVASVWDDRLAAREAHAGAASEKGLALGSVSD